jgi:hypothetical protein
MKSSHPIASLLILIPLMTLFACPQTGAMLDELPRSSRVGPLRIPLVSYERIPIGTLLAHPDRSPIAGPAGEPTNGRYS